jgi:hypothetical protein
VEEVRKGGKGGEGNTRGIGIRERRSKKEERRKAAERTNGEVAERTNALEPH